MFCHKCGNKIADDASFCHGCGAKVVREDVVQAPLDRYPTTEKENSTTKPLPQTYAVPVQTVEREHVLTDNGIDFKTFVDNHVRSTTKFQSARELLNSRVPLGFIWICLGIFAILGILTFNPIVLLLALLLGYGVACAVGAIKRIRYPARYDGKFKGNIDLEDLMQFLNTHLTYLSPHFHEWGFLTREGIGVRGALLTSMAESASEKLKEIRLCTGFGEKEWRLAVIYIRPDILNPDSGQMEYFADVENKISGLPFLSHSTGFSKYVDLVKIAPILQATMEYYLKNYKVEGASKDVLS